MLNIFKLTVIYSEEDNNKNSKNNNSKNNKNNNSKDSKNKKTIKIKNNNLINNNNKYIIIYYIAFIYSWLHAITKKKNCIYYKKYIIY